MSIVAILVHRKLFVECIFIYTTAIAGILCIIPKGCKQTTDNRQLQSPRGLWGSVNDWCSYMSTSVLKRNRCYAL